MSLLENIDSIFRNRKEVKYLVLSLFFHCLVLLLTMKAKAPKSEVISVDPIKIEFITLNSKDSLQKQVVQTEKVEKSEDAAPNAFLGEQTQKVDLETRAGVTAKFNKGDSRISKGEKGNSQKVKKVDLSNLGVKMNYKPMGGLGPRAINLIPSSSNDYLNEVQTGSQTLLNTKEYAYYSFFQRIRGQLEQYWEPNLRTKLAKMIERGRSIAAEKEHATVLIVVLNPSGDIVRIQVEGTSGVLDLDQAAIEAFSKAGPFPNPPKGMLEKDGTVKVNWEFVLKT